MPAAHAQSRGVLGDRVVEPADDSLIGHDPIGITAVGGGGTVGEMSGEALLANDGVGEAPPFGVV